jgi:hypothetical protein
LRHLLAITAVNPAESTFVVDGDSPDSALDFHEDDYCQSQLLPHADLEFCAGELEAIAAFADAHREGDFFTEIYMRKPPPHGLAELRISSSALSEMVGNKLPLRRLVTTGYSSHIERAPRTIGFGARSACCMFAEFDEAGTLRNAWLQLRPDNLLYFDAMRAALSDLGDAYDLIIVDWASADLFSATNHDDLSRYLAKRLSPAEVRTRH